MSSFKTIVSQPAYWKSVLGLGLSFVVVYNLIMVIFDGFTFQPLIDKATNEPLRFIIANILSGFIYGLIMAYVGFRRKQKESQR